MSNIKSSKRATSPKKRLGYGWLIAGVLFLFNPCINIFDLLPDFFGCVFLLKGLEKWADLCPNIADASAGLRKLRWCMLAKIFCIVLAVLLDSTFDLLLTFVFAIIELIYLLPAAARIFDGFEYFGTRFDGKEIFKGIRGVRAITNIFFILKAVLCVLPELCALSTFNYTGYVTSGVQIDFASYRGALNSINIVLTTALGLVWLIIVLSYIKRVSADTPFLVRVLHDYELEIGQNIGLAVRRNLRTTLSLLIAGTVFLPNMWIDGVNVIPTFIGGILIFFAMVNLGRMTPMKKSSVVIPAVFAVISTISYALSLYFAFSFKLDSVHTSFEASRLFNITRIASILEYAAMAALVYIIYRELCRLSKMHLSADPDINDRRLIDIYDSHKRECDTKILIWFICAVVSVTANIAYLLLRANISGDYWNIPFIITLILIAYTANALNQLYERIEYKYM